MISQSLYLDLQVMACGYLANHLDVFVDDELKRFIKPYVLVIHRRWQRGFYLDRQYRHIVDVIFCQEPKSPVRVARQYVPNSPNLPDWSMVDKNEEFDSFWLY